VSRLFGRGGLPIAFRVLIADATRNGCGAVFTPIADHAAHRSRRHDPLAPLPLGLQPTQWRRASGVDRPPPV